MVYSDINKPIKQNFRHQDENSHIIYHCQNCPDFVFVFWPKLKLSLKMWQLFHPLQKYDCITPHTTEILITGISKYI